MNESGQFQFRYGFSVSQRRLDGDGHWVIGQSLKLWKIKTRFVPWIFRRKYTLDMYVKMFGMNGRAEERQPTSSFRVDCAIRFSIYFRTKPGQEVCPVCCVAIRMMCVLRQLVSHLHSNSFKFVPSDWLFHLMEKDFLFAFRFCFVFHLWDVFTSGAIPHSARRNAPNRPNEILLALSILCAADLVWRCNTFGREKVLRTANAPCFCLFCNFHPRRVHVHLPTASGLAQVLLCHSAQIQFPKEKNNHFFP